MAAASVRLWREPLVLPTYAPYPPEKNPMFLERRVYQGSSGKVYPLPMIERIAEEPAPRAWDAVHLENEFLRVTVLPEIGGRIHIAQDKTNGYDFIYRQDVIKPALVGLAGPWISGGIEFNWPQHHRPGTFMPCDVALEEHPDGAKTVWLSEHDPLLRMKGMHGVCLHPGRAVLELKVRAYNRTPLPQTFLWWANLAARVHEGYQSFFPPDVTSVADHAKRSMSSYPRCRGRYYGVDYAARGREGVPASEVPRQFVPPHCRPADAARGPAYSPDDLSWYANIPVPTSYMCTGTAADFFGGYDHRRRAGVIHVADHHIAPGKKQWTWGNQEFGYAWDRNLTEPDAAGEYGPYIELMAGVYTDNQPDFSFLAPGETKTWSQFWYPIREIGPAQQADVEAALSVNAAGRSARIGLAVTRARNAARVVVRARGRTLFERAEDVAPDRPLVLEMSLPYGVKPGDLEVIVRSAAGEEIVRYRAARRREQPVPAPASEPPLPGDVRTPDELFLIGVHLEQYRHATCRPESYWREAIRRDPGDARAHGALARWHLRRGEFEAAAEHARRAIARLTERNPNPLDGEPHYTLGLALRFLGENDDAYAAFAKSAWVQAWQPAAFHALAEIDATRGDWPTALDHIGRALRGNADNLRARNLKAIILRRLERSGEAEALLVETLALDPLDWWARYLRGESLGCDTQVRLDLAHDCARAGLWSDALTLLAAAEPEPQSGTAPLVAYVGAWCSDQLARAATGGHASRRRSGKASISAATREWLAKAAAAPADYCFPARLEEIGILTWAAKAAPRDPHAPAFLGHLLYDRERHAEAIGWWEKSVRRNPRQPIVWRNLGIAYFNVRRDAAKALQAFDRAVRLDPASARLFYERDQLWKRVGFTPERRLRELERQRDLVAQRDDLTVELGLLWLQVGRAADALALATERRFQPWEGGEGLARGIYVGAHVALGREALAGGRAAEAAEHFAAALLSRPNLGEAKHLLANESDVQFWLGCAHHARGEVEAARAAWSLAAAQAGDFRDMAVAEFSDKTLYTARALAKLGRSREARALLRAMARFGRELERRPARIDYFATSLPTMVLFHDDLQTRQTTTARFIAALARLGSGDTMAAKRGLRDVLRRDPNHAAARQELRWL